MSVLVASQKDFDEIKGFIGKVENASNNVHCNCSCSCSNCGHCGCSGYCDIGNCRCRFKPDNFSNASKVLHDFFN